MSEHLYAKRFNGLVTSLGLPDKGEDETSAVICRNFSRTNHRRWLEFIPGIESSIGNPSNDATKGISSVSIKEVQSFSVPDHNGKNVFVAVGTYTKTSHGISPAVTKDSVGIWVRPYWDGAAWVDDWFELTEFYIVKIDSLSTDTQGKIYLKHDVALPASIFKDTYLDGFRAIFGTDYTLYSGADENFLGVISSKVSGADFYIQWSLQNSYVSSRAVGDVFYLRRNFFNADLPTTLSQNILKIADEIRVSTGYSTTDVVSFLGFRTKTFGHAIAGFASLDKFVASQSMDEGHEGSVIVQPYLNSVASSGTVLDAGSYKFKTSLVLDDGQQFALRTNYDSLRGLQKTYDKPVSINTTNSTGRSIFRVSGLHLYCISGGTNGTWLQIQRFLLTDLTTPVWSLNLGSQDGGLVIGAEIVPSKIIVVQDGGAVYSVDQSAGTLTASGTCSTATPVCVHTDYSYVYVGVGSAIDRFAIPGLALTTLATAAAVKGITSDTTHIFAVESGTPSKVEKISKSTFTVTTTLALSSGYNDFTSIAFHYSDGFLYAFRSATGDCKAVKIELVGFTQVSGVQLKKHLDTLLCPTSSGSYIYFSNKSSVFKFAYPDVLASVPTGFTEVYDMFPSSGTPGDVPLGVSGNTGRFAKIETGVEAYTGGAYIQFALLVNPATLPVRAKKVRVYAQKDLGAWLLFHEHDLMANGWGSAEWNYQYRQMVVAATTSIELTKESLALAVSRADILLNHSVEERGVIRYVSAVNSGRTVFAYGVRRAGVAQPGIVAISCQSGEGIPMYDVFPNDSDFELDLKTYDGDDLISSGSVGEKIIVFSRRSFTILAQDNNGVWQIELKVSNVGLSSAKTIVSDNDVVRWLAPNGFHEYSTRGLSYIGYPLDLDIRALSDVVKGAAFSCQDPDRRLYRTYLSGVEWLYDTIDSQWSQETLPITPTSYLLDPETGRMLLATSSGAFKWTAAILQNASPFTATYRTADWNLLAGRGLDCLLIAFYIEYESDVPVTLSVFVDEESTARKTVTLAAGKLGEIVRAPLSVRAKTAAIEISATASVAGQTIKIRQIGLYYGSIPRGFGRRY